METDTLSLGNPLEWGDQEFTWLEGRISEWLDSDIRNLQIDGYAYYHGEQEIYNKTRTAIGADGDSSTLTNLPNHQICNNLTAYAIDQKSNYMFSKPTDISSDNDAYLNKLKLIFDEIFQRSFKQLGKDTIIGGVGWEYPTIKNNKLTFRTIKSYEILPFWKDEEKTEVEFAVRYYEYYTTTAEKRRMVDIFTESGIFHYKWTGKLIPDEVPVEPYIKLKYLDEQSKVIYIPRSWGKVPLIPFRVNPSMTPFLSRVKCLQDAINELMSQHEDNLSEDARNTILIVTNYDGTDLNSFRKNLSEIGVVKVTTVDGVEGGVQALKVDVDSSSYEIVLKQLNKAFFLNARCFDPDSDLMSSRPNETNILQLYSSINLDANDIESEVKASFKSLKYFIDEWFMAKGYGDFSDDNFEISLNRDIIIDESSRVDMMVKLAPYVSKHTFLRGLRFVIPNLNQEIIWQKEEGIWTNTALEQEATSRYGTDTREQTDPSEDRSGEGSE